MFHLLPSQVWELQVCNQSKLQPVNKQDVSSRWNTDRFCESYSGLATKQQVVTATASTTAMCCFVLRLFFPAIFCSWHLWSTHIILQFGKVKNGSGVEVKAERGDEWRGREERQREETGQKSEMFREQRKTARDGVTQSQTGSWWVFLGVLLRQVILMRHDILFWWESWLAMQKLTDGQEIQYWNKIRQKSFYVGRKKP